MTTLELFMEYLTALVFLCAGFRKIAAFQCRAMSSDIDRPHVAPGLPCWRSLVVGWFEVLAALGLVVPFGSWPIANIAAVTLTLLTACAIAYRVRSKPIGRVCGDHVQSGVVRRRGAPSVTERPT